jgi:DNA polymerase-2
MTQQCVFSGLILSKQQFDRNGQLVLVFWLKTKQGALRVEIENEKAIVFCANNAASVFQQTLIREGIQFECKALPLKLFTDLEVTGFYFSSLKHFFASKECASHAGITLYEQDIRHCDRYLMERFIKG